MIINQPTCSINEYYSSDMHVDFKGPKFHKAYNVVCTKVKSRVRTCHPTCKSDSTESHNRYVAVFVVKGIKLLALNVLEEDNCIDTDERYACKWGGKLNPGFKYLLAEILKL